MLSAMGCIGVQKGHFHITYDFIGDVFRASTCGSSRRNSYLIDIVYGIIGFVSCIHYLHPQALLKQCFTHAGLFRLACHCGDATSIIS